MGVTPGHRSHSLRVLGGIRIIPVFAALGICDWLVGNIYTWPEAYVCFRDAIVYGILRSSDCSTCRYPW